MIDKKIGEFAKMFGVGVETIRYYQRQGLLQIPEHKKDASGIRRYGEQDTQRLKFILSAKKAGFTLKEIKALLDCDAKNDRAYIREVSQKRIAMLDKKMAELKEARDFLHQLIDECRTTTSEACPILHAFE
ncbi:MerR family transcriptional regulator [Fluoribacter dumoffii]|uniref:Mercuric resistance operon regulatory protein n=1 Tax=Fluoribacter dumoffii TaxID=463 RepID=A0A377G7X7_9GAMM|nr:MerR family transcriptional regulator [Fluoribacter dumoffii]KTC89339.1 transcriptional regulator, MerR family [Fluoribacter dumoffii NY 23]MCW8386902.1 MerR family transcriptional regulator [Fluoribacter dumoffii]MCW8497104.1 MerR family transcriptional regulator [Fluoribacter dumoffii]STO20448.1 Mercuric resistance operon regulatory protein [Fluoribacter dumoffii]